MLLPSIEYRLNMMFNIEIDGTSKIKLNRPIIEISNKILRAITPIMLIKRCEKICFLKLMLSMKNWFDISSLKVLAMKNSIECLEIIEEIIAQIIILEKTPTW